jgi:integrase
MLFVGFANEFANDSELSTGAHRRSHSRATLLLAAGEPLHVVADRLGHKDAMVTSTVYAHVLAEQADQAADTFARVSGID